MRQNAVGYLPKNGLEIDKQIVWKPKKAWNFIVGLG